MNDRNPPAVNKVPFLIADLLLLGSAAVLVKIGLHPLSFQQTLLCLGLVILGAIFSVIPFLLEYKAAVKFAESDKLNDAVSQIHSLETLAKQISGATAQWQDVQATSGKTVTAAKEIAARMDTELESFKQFIQQANESEKAALRLEVEKLRRAEGDWLQINVRILDHIFALHQAAVRSGNPELTEQLSLFQNACRDVARRIGLVFFAAEANEPFDPKRHKVLDSETAVEGAQIAEPLAPGFSFQSQLLRPALVKLQTSEAPQMEAPSAELTPVEPQENQAEPTLL